MIQTTLIFTLNVDPKLDLPCAKHATTWTDDPELSAHVATNTIHFMRCALEAQGIDIVSIQMINAIRKSQTQEEL